MSQNLGGSLESLANLDLVSLELSGCHGLSGDLRHLAALEHLK